MVIVFIGIRIKIAYKIKIVENGKVTISASLSRRSESATIGSVDTHLRFSVSDLAVSCRHSSAM